MTATTTEYHGKHRLIDATYANALSPLRWRMIKAIARRKAYGE